MKLELISESNYPQVATIYLEGLKTGMATFETEAPDWNKWNTSHLKFGRIAFSDNNQLLGWAALSPVSSRCVYGGVAEVSIYVAEKFRGKGIGKKLMQELIKVSEENAIWTLQAGIMKANEGSIQMHIKSGFRVIGYREKIGKLHDTWLDNVILERRSKIIGV